MQRTIRIGLVQAHLQQAQVLRGILAASICGEESDVVQHTWIRKASEICVHRRTFSAMENAKLLYIGGMDKSWLKRSETAPNMQRLNVKQILSQQSPAMQKADIDSTRASLRRRQRTLYQEMETLLQDRSSPSSILSVNAMKI